VDTGEAIMMPDNETINKHIHKMLNKCWHEWEPNIRPKFGGGESVEFFCRCGARTPNGPRNTEYTSDDSPRRLLNEAVDKAVEMVGENVYALVLLEVTYKSTVAVPWTPAINASAQQIATAIYHATKEEGK
jgi:hypothetical protein